MIYFNLVPNLHTFSLISKEISWAEHKNMNIHPLPIKALATALHFLFYRIDVKESFSCIHNCSYVHVICMDLSAWLFCHEYVGNKSLEPVCMIPLSRDEMRGGVILMY